MDTLFYIVLGFLVGHSIRTCIMDAKEEKDSED